MMFLRHPSRLLVAYCDGQLPSADVARVEGHVAACARCRGEVEQIQFAVRLVRGLAVVSAPDGLWQSIERQIPATTSRRAEGLAAASAKAGRWPWRYAIATVAVIVMIASVLWTSREAGPWVVAMPDGLARMAAGDVIAPTAAPARITVGTIGTVDVEPGSRVRLGAAAGNEFRLALERGRISARISAPPRMFVVDTAASTVVDLGCAYTMDVAEDGAGELRMTEGWASLEWGGRESLVPAGAIGRTRPGVGPGTPFFEDAVPALVGALTAFDFERGGEAALAVVLAEARGHDTLTLWHLLSRVDPADRARVYDRLAALTPPPATVSRARVLELDPAMLTHLREELAWTW